MSSRHAGDHRWISRFRTWIESTGDEPGMSFDRSQFEDVETQLWGMSPERRWYLQRRPRAYGGALMAAALLMIAALLGQPPRTDREAWWTVLLAAVGVATLAYSTFPFWAARLAFTERRRKMASYVASDTLREVRTAEELPLHLLFAYNRRQLDAYQEEARNQQRIAFRYALFTSVLGLGVLVAGIAASLRVGPGTEGYVAAGLSAVGAALSAYIAATMLRISQQADVQLNRFSMEPHMMSRLLLAERLTQSADAAVAADEREAMIKQVLEWPLPGEGQSLEEIAPAS